MYAGAFQGWFGLDEFLYRTNRHVASLPQSTLWSGFERQYAMAFDIREAAMADLDQLVPLFDAYRQFYRLESDISGARQFLRDRIERGESVILLAWDGPSIAGFTQLYPSFSSGAMARTFILNDLFVAPDARRCGVGSELLQSAADFGRRSGAVRLTLSTE